MRKNILFLITIIAFVTNAIAQNDPCTAYPLDVNKTYTTGQMVPPFLAPNLNLPCGGGGETHNPIWWVFRPSGSIFSFTMTVSSCVAGGCGSGVQSTVWEGQNCGSITAVDCQVGLSMTYTLSVNPCKIYYIQADGLCGAQCKITITYDKTQLLGSVPKPIISGNKQVCKGLTTKYCATSAIQGCDADSYKWTLNPANSGTVTAITGEYGCANVKITNPPLSGKVQVCAEPVFTGKSLPTTTKECYEIDVFDLKTSTCTVDICPEDQPYVYDLTSCIKTTNPDFKGTISPSTYSVNLPAGTQKAQTVNYTLDGTSCKNSVQLNIQVADNKPTTLRPLLLCEGEQQQIKGTLFSCADGSTVVKKFVKENQTQCDSIFEMLVQCIKVNPKITGVGALDCSTTQLTLNAGGIGTITSPNSINLAAYQGKGTREYTWSKNGMLLVGETNPTLLVTSPGLYEVTLSYTYEVTQIINGQTTKTSKTCSKTTSAQIIGNTNISIAETPIGNTNPCANTINTYYVTPDPIAKAYQWYVTGGASIVGSNTNPSKVEVQNNGLPYEICLVKLSCQKTSVPNCLSVTPIAAPLKPIIVGKNPACQWDSALYKISNAMTYSSNANYIWTVQNGSITSYNTDSSQIYIKWNSTASIGKIKVKVTEPCGMSSDSIVININSCTTRSAGIMALKFVLTANNPSKSITARHQAGTEFLLPNDTYAYVLHEGSENKIINLIGINKTGTFAFDSTKMKCNRVYFVSYVVGDNQNNLPNLQDNKLSVVPKGQSIAWLCKSSPIVLKRESEKQSMSPKNYQINIYPNPTEDNFYIELPKVINVSLDLYNIQGQLVLSQNEMKRVDDNKYEAPVSHLPKGIYLLKMKLDGRVEVRKVIVE
jgi:hypothetical protein